MNLQNWQFPPPLQPGDLLYVIAPSGALKELERFKQGIEVWRKRGYQVELASHWDARYGYLAGTDEQRRKGLWDAWRDRQCKAILCARGGYGGARLLEQWQWEERPPKWLIGFSDVTGLLWSLATRNIGSLHGPVLTTLGNEPHWTQARLFAAVEGRSLPPLQGTGWGGGTVTGRLLPANLTVATHLLFTPVQPDLKGVILALEDVTEAPYRLDRMLTQWRMSGVLQQVAGIALGRFSQCEGNPGTWTVEEMFRDRLSDLAIPIVSELPFGHDGANAVLPVGRMAKLDGDGGELRVES
ncbi:LD-carboxypeptidase [Spirulina sp. CS-785/01]|uniref:S66 peptidase family protein n=1 Tax=Spirulina sp. CS-785/01 TaxID=3021716 RepID=UPI00232C6602|nr:LD-carboxypeptidase [Spirulina sp. CS-785/01]MDB9314051.1 LD-carboxypeptidase [Spirulina sp. CS-785/01]